jgi:aquaporin Z
MSISNRAAAEFFGTFWLVFGGCGTAVLGAAVPFGVGHLGVALAFGLTVLTGVYALGHISGGHFNPSISVALVVARRFSAKDLLPYVAAQLGGAVTGAAVLFVIARGIPTFTTAAGFASNGYGAHSPQGYSLLSALVVEVVTTFMFVMVVLGATDARAPKGFAGLAIGLALTLIHLVSIPVTNGSVNPARSTGPALFVGGWALSQLWLFWVAPILGAGLAGLLYPAISGSESKA